MELVGERERELERRLAPSFLTFLLYNKLGLSLGNWLGNWWGQSTGYSVGIRGSRLAVEGGLELGI